MMCAKPTHLIQHTIVFLCSTLFVYIHMRKHQELAPNIKLRLRLRKSSLAFVQSEMYTNTFCMLELRTEFDVCSVGE